MIMRGEFIHVWPETWDEIWMLVRGKSTTSPDFYTELFREVKHLLNYELVPDVSMKVLVDENLCEEEFKSLSSDSFYCESNIIELLENAYWVMDDLGGETLSQYYFNCLERFIVKYSLRYVLQRPCVLCPSLPGMFSALVRELHELTNKDEHQKASFEAFENALKDLRQECNEDRIKTCIQKQINLLEAMGQSYPGVTQTELGGMCDQIKSWPHVAIGKSLKKLYGFSSDYPGIRHGCKSDGVIRNINKRDAISLLITFTGFMPYLSEEIDVDSVYGGIRK